MKSKTFSVSILLPLTVLVLCVSSITFSQTKKSTATPAQSSKTQLSKSIQNCSPEYNSKITQIRGYVEKAKSFQNQLLRGKLIIDLNSLLWECDEQFARNSFSSFWQAISSEIETAKFKKKDTATNTEDEIKKLNKSLATNEYLQQYLISRLQALDKTWANQLSKVLTSQEKGVVDYLAVEGNFDPNKPNPQQLDLIRKFLRNNSTIRTIPFLIDFKKQNSQTADQLFLELLSLSQNNPNLSFEDVMELGTYLYASRLFYNTDAGDSTYSVTLPGAPLVLDLTTKRNEANRNLTVPYLNLTARFLSKQVLEPEEKTRRYIFGRIMLAHVLSDAPEFADSMQQALQIHFDGVPDKYKDESFYEIYRKINTASEPDYFERNLLDLEKTIGSDNRDDTAVRLIRALFIKGQYERIEKVAQYISDIDKRDSILDVSKYTQAIKLIDNGKTDEAQLMLKKIAKPSIKALVGFRIIQILQSNKSTDSDLTDQFIYEIISDAKKSDDEYTPLLLFALAKIVYKKDEGLGYDLISTAVKKLNDNGNWDTPKWRFAIAIPTLSPYPVTFNIKRIQGLDISESLNFLIKESKTSLEEVLLTIRNENIQSAAVFLLAKQYLAEAKRASSTVKKNAN